MGIVSLLRRWIWVATLVKFFTPTVMQAAAAPSEVPKPQRLRKKKHFRQAHNNPIIDEVAQGNQLNEVASNQAGQFHTPEPSAAYVKCRSMLEGVAGSDDLVNKSEYVQFVKSLTGGKVNANSFDDLEGRWSTIFYQTACAQGRECDGDDVTLVLNDTLKNYQHMAKLCYTLMEQATTTAVLTFGYSVRYDSSSISEVRNDFPVETTMAIFSHKLGLHYL